MSKETFKGMPTGEEFAKYLFDNPCIFAIKKELDDKLLLLSDLQMHQRIELKDRLKNLEEKFEKLEDHTGKVYKCDKCNKFIDYTATPSIDQWIYKIKVIPLQKAGNALNFVLCDSCCKKLLELIG